MPSNLFRSVHRPTRAKQAMRRAKIDGAPLFLPHANNYPPLAHTGRGREIYTVQKRRFLHAYTPKTPISAKINVRVAVFVFDWVRRVRLR
jgi:hypothetical protein